jgi:hypothetical protein
MGMSRTDAARLRLSDREWNAECSVMVHFEPVAASLPRQMAAESRLYFLTASLPIVKPMVKTDASYVRRSHQ